MREREHILEAAANYQRYQRLLDGGDPDWALTLLFYSAVHLVQACAEQEATRPGSPPAPANHGERLDYVANRLARVFTAYRTLQEASEDARYDLVKRTEDEVRRFHDNEYRRLREGLQQRGLEFQT